MTANTAGHKPILFKVREGRSYNWCACGLSRKQPFCDGSHRATNIEPLRWVASRTEEVLLCVCKQSGSAPLCDGTHNRLTAMYTTASDADCVGAAEVDYEVGGDGARRAMLDNGCFVIRLADDVYRTLGNLRLYPAIGAVDGATAISQYACFITTGRSPALRFAGSDVALFITDGAGSVTIGAREFSVVANDGVCIKPGESFVVDNPGDDPLRFNLSVCPLAAEYEVLEVLPDRFDESLPQRVRGIDASQQESMGDRFFQVLLNEESHRTPITQFIGDIPRSRAAHHRHLYEETLTVLGGEGYMWTDRYKARVRPGDTIFLPLKQMHSLECTSPGGMRLIGLFYPSMSPAINY